MPNYLAPDVYVEEVSGGPRPIEAVGTSTAALIGVAPDAAARPGEILSFTNWSAFVRTYAPPGKASTPLSQAVYGFFQNGGRLCYVVNVGAGGTLQSALDKVAQKDDVAIVAAPGYTDAASYDALLSHCELLGDRVAVLDAPLEVDDLDALTTTARPAGAARPATTGSPDAPKPPAGGTEPPADVTVGAAALS